MSRPSVPASPRRGSSKLAAPDTTSSSQRPRSSSGSRRASIPLSDSEVLQCRLTFIDCSIGDIRNCVLSENSNFEFNTLFWYTVLTQQPSNDFLVMQAQSLEFWISIFNKWQKAGYPEYLDGDLLNQIFYGTHRGQLLRVARLFDPVGYRRIQAEGNTAAAYSRMKVSAVKLMMAGVLLSNRIHTGFKLRYIFGLVDVRDSQRLEEFEFFKFISNFIGALGAVFDISEEISIMPSAANMGAIAKHLYKHISQMSANKIKRMYAKGDASTKASLVAAIRERQRRPQRAQTMQALKYKTIEKWCFLGLKDPLGVPYALAIERFCVLANGDTYAKIDWYLSHAKPVTVPEGGSIPVGLTLPSLGDILLCRSSFEHAMSRGFCRTSLSDLEAHVQREYQEPEFEFERVLWERLSSALALCSLQGCQDFGTFLRFVYSVDDVTIQMFKRWVDEHDCTVDKSKKASKAAKAAHAVARKTTIPMEELQGLLSDFNSIDREGLGYINAQDLSERWDMDIRSLKLHMDTIGIPNCNEISQDDYLRMVCPEDYRLPEKGDVDKLSLFGALVHYKNDKLIKKMATSGTLSFSKSGTLSSVESSQQRRSMPPALWPEISQSLWEAWEDAFRRLDLSGDGRVGVAELRGAGLDHDICDYLVDVLCKEDNESFGREKFLSAMLKAHQYRRKGFQALSLKSKKKNTNP